MQCHRSFPEHMMEGPVICCHVVGLFQKYVNIETITEGSELQKEGEVEVHIVHYLVVWAENDNVSWFPSSYSAFRDQSSPIS